MIEPMGSTKIEVVKQLRAEFPDLEMTLVWDGAPYHRSGEVKTAISEFNGTDLS